MKLLSRLLLPSLALAVFGIEAAQKMLQGCASPADQTTTLDVITQ